MLISLGSERHRQDHNDHLALWFSVTASFAASVCWLNILIWLIGTTLWCSWFYLFVFTWCHSQIVFIAFTVPPVHILLLYMSPHEKCYLTSLIWISSVMCGIWQMWHLTLTLKGNSVTFEKNKVCLTGEK